MSVRLVPSDYAKLSKRKRGFIESFIRCGNAKQAYLAQGYRDTKNAMMNARALRRELNDHIRAKLGEYVTSTDMAILAYSQIKELALHADSEAIRFNASKEVLTRGGWDAPKEVTYTVNHKNLSNEELEDRIKEVTGLLVVQPKLEAVK